MCDALVFVTSQKPFRLDSEQVMLCLSPAIGIILLFHSLIPFSLFPHHHPLVILNLFFFENLHIPIVS
jgi:hypothetical protein